MKSIQEQAEAYAQSEQGILKWYPISVYNVVERAFIAGASSLQGEVEKYERAIVSLTPGGSEFVNDPERCVEFVKESLAAPRDTILRLKGEVERLREENERLKREIQRIDDVAKCGACKKVTNQFDLKTYRGYCPECYHNLNSF